MTRRPRVLVCRLDNIGDVVLTTPAMAAIRKRYPAARITCLIGETAAPLLERFVDPLEEFVGSIPGLAAATQLQKLRDEWGR